MPLLVCVICFQLPVAPAQTSGAAENELRTAAEILPSAEIEMDGPQVPIEMWSAPL